MKPHVSVIMSVYNTPVAQLRQSIASVLSQTYTAFTCYICDDGSCAETARFLETVQRRDSRIVVLRNAHNQGLAYSLNKCIAAAQDEILIRQDGDDYSMPERFAALAETMQAHPAFDIVSSNVVLFDDGGVWGRMCYPCEPKAEDFLFCVPFVHGAVALRKQAVLDAGGYRVAKETRRAEDIDLFMRMYANESRGYTVQQELYAFREDAHAKKRRRYRYRIDEAKVKYRGYRLLGLMPRGLPYVIKPLVVGLLPQFLLDGWKDRYYGRRRDMRE